MIWLWNHTMQKIVPQFSTKKMMKQIYTIIFENRIWRQLNFNKNKWSKNIFKTINCDSIKFTGYFPKNNKFLWFLICVFFEICIKSMKIKILNKS